MLYRATRIQCPTSKCQTFVWIGPHRKLSQASNLIHRHVRSLSTVSSAPLYKDKHYDVLIVGGGAVGSTLARSLSLKVPSLSVALLDAQSFKPADSILKKEDASSQSPNARAYALSPKSLKLIGNDIVDRLLKAGRVGVYDAMQIWESDGPATLHFTKDDLSSQLHSQNQSQLTPTGTNSNSKILNKILGAVIEDQPLVSSIWDELRACQKVDLIAPAKISNIIPPWPSSASPSPQPHVKVTLQHQNSSKDDEEVGPISITTNLLVAADGANSHIRKTLGVFPTVSAGYGRTAVTCTVTLDRSIKRTAFQRFQPNGPIALLPVWDEDHDDSTNASENNKCTYANIVWSTTPEEAEILQNMTEDDFIQQLNHLLQTGPVKTPHLFPEDMKKSMPGPLEQAAHGLEMLTQSINAGLSMSAWTERGCGFATPPKIKSVIGRRFAFDLNLMHAKNYVGERVALVGDAAHTIHPMAGQGLNLGMADAESLTKHLQQAVESGMGLKSNAGLQYALQQYESERQREVVAVMGGIQFLHEAFSTTFSPAIFARSAGMNVVNSVGPLRRYLANIATGSEILYR